MKHSKITLLAALLLLAIMIPILAACQCLSTPSDGTTADTEEQTQPRLPVTEEAPASGTLIWDGSDMQYLIIMPADADSETKSLAYNLRNELNTLTGKKFKCVFDNSVAAEASTDGEILIGKTNRPESANAYENLREKDWLCKSFDTRIVIAANSYNALCKAIDHFQASLVQTANGSLYSTADELYKGSYYIDSLSVGGTPVQEYVLVCPANDPSTRMVAEELAKSIADYCGYVLTVCEDSTAPAAHEILVGKTNRPESAALQATLSTGDSGKLELTGKKLTAVYQNRLAAEVLQARFKEHLTSLIGKSDAALGTAPLSVTDDFDSDGKREFTVLSFNIWNVFNSSLRPLANRDDMAASLILSYLPDVFGLQEFDALFRTGQNDFSDMVSKYYAEVKCDGVRER